ncbi:MAG: nitrophenyl compound nitroreductase subunit ArsF family protein [Candidatus Woesearchaeota archaeon]
MRFMIVLIMLTMVIAGCTGLDESSTTGNSVAEKDSTGNTGAEDSNAAPEDSNEINIDKLEIYHFHGANQCYSCITVGDYAEDTVNTYFKDELESGKIVFDHINGEVPENKELVQKYGATGSSLWLGVYDDGFTAEQNTQVWYKIKDKQAYMNYLKGVIEEKLAGE